MLIRGVRIVIGDVDAAVGLEIARLVVAGWRRGGRDVGPMVSRKDEAY